MLSGMLFQLNWNTVPTYLEQESNLAITKRKLKKLTTRTYRVSRERWRLEVGSVSLWQR
ncbi:thioesterase [Hoylesella loescheii]|uniref:thioesterase n=1 Tax=Hoylesella loescheii TaxID=840 RepID=UPI00248EC04D|nr:thioesterase [Hoylesella loescheii]